MEAIILASGMGTRLSTVTRGRPKCFSTVGDKLLIEYPMTSLRRAGVTRFIIVVPQGFLDEGKRVLRRLGVAGEVVENTAPELGNAYSILLAGRCVRSEQSFAVCCDTIIPASFPIKLKQTARKDVDLALAASRNYSFINYDEATKVVEAGDRIIDIGKHIKHSKLIDTGLFIVGKKFLSLWGEIGFDKENHLYQLVKAAVRRGLKTQVVDVGVEPWMEIDTPSDLASLLEGKGREVLINWRRHAR